MFPQQMVDSLIFPWDKDKKTELKNQYLNVQLKENGSCYKTYTLCNLGYMVSVV